MAAMIGQALRLDDLETYLKQVGISPDTVKKIFEDVSQSAQNLRPVDFIGSVPLFRPTFVKDAGPNMAKLEDFGLLNAPEPRHPQRPFRISLQIAHQIGAGISIEDLSKKRLSARATNTKLEYARGSADKAKAKLKFAEIERTIFHNIIDRMKDEIDDKTEANVERDNPGLEDADLSCAERSKVKDLSTANQVVEEARDEALKAASDLIAAEKELDDVRKDVDLFTENSQLREAVDGMVRLLQKWKSAIKIEQSIGRARSIFREKPFRKCERCYLRLDTCCIDKKNGGELSDSLSLMGDWFSESEAVVDWQRFQVKEKEEECRRIPADAIRSFQDIRSWRPEWSERGWTLQELLMSKTTFYVDGDWSPLSRPVDDLGHFFYLIPYISLKPYPCRALYPSSHEAFSRDDRGYQYNLLLSQEIRDKIDDVMVTYNSVVSVLREGIDFVRKKQRRDLPFTCIRKIVEIVQNLTFQALKPELENVGRVMRYILKGCHDPPSSPHPVDARSPSLPLVTGTKGFKFPGLTKGLRLSSKKVKSEPVEPDDQDLLPSMFHSAVTVHMF
ncbi:hypothetical protein HRG_001286 [Hirsutella rhossiliensis]|uniref:Heterokaryon incompatibility domain-containing protein n=1 Tax=Hirsutella rhossiliensis TaxID=111463 RepID=A0A9P8SNQ4_9HYPO|nr:uncharacterized protein HRG_01286 [Hirsutella rhossiliensis]KAH0968644.1 hypothetical protein HRG_01286 [Hirsutella rhossiliensis]